MSLWILALMCACAPARRDHLVPPMDHAEVGTASWYGPGFHGKRTASGSVYDQYALTAAHRTLPFGTRLRVTNLRNDESVELRITDRGPFARGRIIDLSYAAARTIHMIGAGTALVRLDVLVQLTPLPCPRYVVQVASFRDPARAAQVRREIADRFPDAQVIRASTPRGTTYRVYLGPYPLRSIAHARLIQLAEIGWPALVVEDSNP